MNASARAEAAASFFRRYLARLCSLRRCCSSFWPSGACIFAQIAPAAAAAGVGMAMVNMALMYQRGEGGLKKDLKKAFQL